MRVRSKLLTILGFICTVSFFSCNNFDLNYGAASSTPAAIQLSASELNMVNAISNVTERQVQAVVTGTVSSTVVWKSSNTNIFKVASLSSTECKITAIGNGSAYLIARTSDGKLAAKCSVNVGLSNINCDPVTNLSADEITNCSVKINWNAPDEAISVKVELYQNAKLVAEKEVKTTEKSVVFDNLRSSAKGLAYTVKAWAIVNGNKSDVAEASFKLAADSTPPAEVSEITKTASLSKVELNWKDPSDADFEKLLISVSGLDKSGNPYDDAYIAKGVQNLILKNVQASTNYVFTIKTIDRSGNISAGISEEAYTPPAEVEDLVVVVKDGKVEIKWTDPTSPIFAKVKILSGETVLAEVEKGIETALIDVDAEKTYEWTICCVDTSDAVSAGIPVSFDTKTAAEKLESCGSVITKSGDFTLSWSMKADASSDLVYAEIFDGETKVVDFQPIENGKKIKGLDYSKNYSVSLYFGSEQNDIVYLKSNSASPMTKIADGYKIVSGYGDRVFMCNILNSSENGCETDYNVIAEEENIVQGKSGNVPVVNYSNMKYKYWLICPSLKDSADSTKFSLMATDETASDSGYYLYVDASRKVSSTANLRSWYTDVSTVNSWANKMFVAKLSESYISDSNLAVFTKEDSPTGGDWFELQNEKTGLYLQHANCVYKAVTNPASAQNCADFKYSDKISKYR